ncbi:WD40 repeat-like protein [Leucogyrophana mollusca]|uniref:WD40 repeat-like protein n=1 Tax=Leucogyrophana mollusca TaxID=85980 RepID=A0ACB8C1A2_9AGAM|nr:WD40 repeat-like protein [Leucogyrophana mollusca]
MSIPANSYVCDTLPAARLASGATPEPELSRSPSPPPIYRVAESESIPHLQESKEDVKQDTEPPQPAPRKLCVRHQRMADEGTNRKLQQSLDALPVQEREAVNAIWSNFSSSSHPRRELILQGLLTMCCFSQLSLLTEQLGHLIRIDPFTVLPREVSLKILAHLDATSLCRAAQVSRQWRSLADDDILWRGICEQHIGQKCLKCGWGLPILEKKRTTVQRSAASPAPPSPLSAAKRQLEGNALSARPMKRQRSEPDDPSLSTPLATQPAASTSRLVVPSNSTPRHHTPSDLLLAPALSETKECETVTRPWKDVYSERLTVERNWRRGRCTVRTLKGHTDGVMCLQFSETLPHPSFPILITGSYDRTVRVWNLETGLEVRCLRGHTRAVRALQFDECKLITGSMDHTIRVWDWRRGECIRTLEGHTEGVVCLNYDSNVLASGSVDSTVKVWNFRTGEAFTLRGHRDWVNAVRLWDSGNSGPSMSSSFDTTLDTSNSAPQICSGKMLFSASDDGTIKLWDLARRTCVRQFTGHVGQVQSLKLLEVDEGCEEGGRESKGVRAERFTDNRTAEVTEVGSAATPGELFTVVTHDGAFPVVRTPSESIEDMESLDKSTRRSLAGESSPGKRTKKPMLISGSLDNTIKMWDIETGKATETLFGHIEGVWAVASDKLRLLSGSHDRTIKVWNREEGRCTATLFGHRGAVTCLGLGEDKIVSGSDDGDVRIWSFGG